MSNKYFKDGNTFSVTDGVKTELVDQLPPGNYNLRQDRFGNFHFDRADDFTLPAKLYGDTASNANRVLNTFNDRPGTTGILLSGEKGSGKTLLAKQISILGASLGIPTILINSPWRGDRFNALIQSMTQPVILFFDEFEKVYDRDQQPALLTLMDGTFSSKKLFVMTCNDKFRVDSFMRNRPGRIYYAMDFKGLTPDFVREYAEDNLKDKSQIETLARVSSVFAEFNFDMLKALVEEVNRYGESPAEALRLLNIRPQYDDTGTYNISILAADGSPLPVRSVYPTQICTNPMTQREHEVHISFSTKVARAAETTQSDGLEALLASSDDDEDEVANKHVSFGQDALKTLDADAGLFVYAVDGLLVQFKRKVTSLTDYHFAAAL